MSIRATVTSYPKSPVNACAKAWIKTTAKDKRNSDFSHTGWRDSLREFVAAVSMEGKCIDMRGRKTTCTCMAGLAFDDINDCAFYLEDFACKKKDSRQQILLEWMRYAKVMKAQQSKYSATGNPMVYLLPSSSEVLICANACARLIGFGESAWKTVKQSFDVGTVPCHQLVGKAGNKKVKAFDSLLHDFFIKLEGLAAPRATRLVRDIVGDRVEVSIRDNDDEGEIELPTYYTKRSLYKKLAADCQYELSCNSKGKYLSKTSLIEDNQVEKLPDWATFHAFWKKHYSHIRIPKPSEDICEDCHKFVNAYKTAYNKNKRKATALEEADSSGSGEEGGEDDTTVGDTGTASIPSLDEDDSTGEL